MRAPGHSPRVRARWATPCSREAGKAEADLLVMGAYGHSRLREMVIGGVTRGILGDAAIPVLLMH